VTAYPRSDAPKPGSWAPYPLADGRTTALFRCPTCGEPFDFFEYEIGSDGSILAPVFCPYPRCGWKGNVKLADWPTPGH